MSETEGDHPPPARLRAFSCGGLDGPGHASVGAHVAACPLCWERLEQLGDHDPFLERLRQALATPAPPPAADPRTETNIRGPHEEGNQPAAPAPAVPGYELLGEVGRARLRALSNAPPVTPTPLPAPHPLP